MKRILMTLPLAIFSISVRLLADDTFIIPHFISGPPPASGAPFRIRYFLTVLDITNAGSTEAQIRVQAFGNDGRELPIGIQTLDLAPLTSRSVPMSSTELKTGWLRIESPGQVIIRGSCYFYDYPAVGAPPPPCGQPPVSFRSADPVKPFLAAVAPVTVNLSNSCGSTGVALVFPGQGSQTAEVRLTLTDSAGLQVGHVDLNLRAGRQDVFLIEDLFPKVRELPDQLYQLKIVSNAAVSGAAVTFGKYGAWRTVDLTPLQ